MSKYWAIRSRVDGLSLYAYAATEAAAIKVVEELVGPLNPAQRIVTHLADRPEGFRLPWSSDPQVLDEAIEDEE